MKVIDNTYMHIKTFILIQISTKKLLKNEKKGCNISFLLCKFLNLGRVIHKGESKAMKQANVN